MSYFITALVSFWCGIYAALRLARWYYRSGQ